MRETRVTVNSSDLSRAPAKRATDSSRLELHVHFYICLAPCFTQKAVIKEGIVTERIQPTNLEERRWKIGMRTRQNGRHLWIQGGRYTHDLCQKRDDEGKGEGSTVTKQGQYGRESSLKTQTIDSLVRHGASLFCSNESKSFGNLILLSAY